MEYTTTNPILTTDVAEDRFSVGSTIGSVQTNEACSKKIGMLTIDEAFMAGGRIGSLNQDYYLYTNSSWWLGSPSHSNYLGTIWVSLVDGDGKIATAVCTTSYGLRPVISLKADVKIKGGTGTQTDPYIITTN